MAMTVRECNDAEREIAAATSRDSFFPVAGGSFRQTAGQRQGRDVDVCSPRTVAALLRGGLDFGRELHGGDCMFQLALWPVVFRQPAWKPGLDSGAAKRAGIRGAVAAAGNWPNGKRRTATTSGFEPPVPSGKRNTAWSHRRGIGRRRVGLNRGWYCHSWKNVNFPNTWEQLGFKFGRGVLDPKEVDIPAGEAGKPFRLVLSAMDEQ